MLLAAVIAISLAAEPSDQTVLFYNARLALRDGKPADALRLWLMRNVVANRDQAVGRYDEEFRSVVWASTGALGLCQELLALRRESGFALIGEFAAPGLA